MFKVKTFSSPLKVLQTARELAHLDDEVAQFLAQNNATRVVSVSDVATTDSTGATIGVLRVVCYETQG
ncbi:MAG: hypothetical protein HY683_07695 [Chloroflexi bacterium]|nr:hypothetical protein [Chloroflexota bacterium]